MVGQKQDERKDRQQDADKERQMQRDIKIEENMEKETETGMEMQKGTALKRNQHTASGTDNRERSKKAEACADKTETYHKETGESPISGFQESKIMQGVRLLLEGIGEDPTREGLLETPERIARMYREIFAGMNQSASVPLSKTFHTENTDMILERDITFYSTCEHHLLPFYGKAHVAYIPDGKVAGLSKLARTVSIYAGRLQLQERMTVQIADALMEYLKPKGAMVMLEAEHMCMTMRGIRQPGSTTVTFAARGVFAQKETLQNRFFQMTGRT